MHHTFAAAALLCLAAAGSARPFTAKDLATLDRISSPRVSADGRYVAYAVRSTDWDANKGVNALYVIDLQGDVSKPLRLLKDEKGGASPRWSKDGRWLYFLSSKSGSQQVWQSTPDGSVQRQLTSFPIDVAAFALGPDEPTLFVAAQVYPDCATIGCTKDRNDEKSKPKSSGLLIKSGPGRFWDSYLEEKKLGLFRVDLTQQGAAADAQPIVKGFAADVPADGDNSNLAISSNGRTVYFASADPSVDPGGPAAYTRIYAVPADGSRAPQVLIGKDGMSVGAPAVSPDGTRLAYLSVTQPLLTYGRTALMVSDLKTGRSREVAPTLDADFGSLAWSTDGRTLLATGDDHQQTILFRIDPSTGHAARLTSNGTVSAFDAARGTVAYVRDDLQSPGQLFVQQGSAAPRQLTHAGDKVLAEAPMSPSEQFTFAGWNGDTVTGFVVKPTGFVEGRKYPVAFLIHGGPHGSFANAWSYRWNPQVWAGMGYAVVSVDFHGSSGYGEQFGRAIIGHWGDRPLEDLQKGWAYALSKYPYLDSSRACALGGSYGGYMVAWIASQWNEPWRCLVDHAGVFDVRSQAWAMDSTSFIGAQFGSSANPEDWERFNPARYSSRWTKPILVIHGGRDFRVPTEQGIAAHNAARVAGVPTELLIFPDENHWVLKPQNSVQWYQNVQEWLDRWTGNSAAPAQPAQ